MKYYVAAQLSENISETPEGYLVCANVPLTRTGSLLYAPNETPVTPGAGATTITRTAADIFDARTIASFEGKPVTIGHPEEFVGPDNWQTLAVGVIQNVRPGSGADSEKLLGDLLITDREAIHAVKARGLREVSCGYEADYEESAPGVGRQLDIRGNHLALVPRGRCGSECAIQDHAADFKNKGKTMSLKEKLLAAFGKAVDSAMEEEDPMQAMDASMKGMDARMKAMEDAFAAFAKKFEKKTGDQESEQAANKEEKQEEKQPDPLPELTSEEVANAEILAPGIAKTGDAKQNALKAVYATQDGKAMLDRLSGGKAPAFDSDLLFNAAAELVKEQRAAALSSTKTAKPTGDAKAFDFYANWSSKVSATHPVNRV